MAPHQAADQELARAWEASSGTSEPPSVFWPICDILASEGLLLGDESKIATIRVGPFRYANTPYREAVRDFIEVLLPAVFGGSASGSIVGGLVSGFAGGATRLFIELQNRGVRFGRDRVSVIRWLVLNEIRSLQDGRQGEGATESELADLLVGRLVMEEAIDEDEVALAIRWLVADGGAARDNASPISLVQEAVDGTLTSLA